MALIYNKGSSLFVAWLNIFLAIALPVTAYAVTWYSHRRFGETENFNVPLRAIVILSAALLPWLLTSILLLKGIKENRPKLMLFWIYAAYFYAFLNIMGMFSIFFIMAASNRFNPAGLVECIHMIVAGVAVLLCIIPVKILHNKMTLPPAPIVEPIQIVFLEKKHVVEADPRYIPIFEGY